MDRRISARRTVVVVCFVGCLFGLSPGMMCLPGGCDDAASLDPPLIFGDGPPRITILAVNTPSGDNVAQQGDLVIVEFSAQDDSPGGAAVRLFGSQSPDPDSPARIEIPVFRGDTIGPGASTGEGTWDTAGVEVGAYYIFAEIDDHIHVPVRAASLEQLTIIPIPPEGTDALGSPPQLVFIDPLPNLGLAAMDEVTVRYIYADPDSSVTLTLLLDKDLDPTNDNVSNPGDPQDPNTNIIILPSTTRLPTDPTFDGDPPPPDDPDNPPIEADSVEIRRNPRTLLPTASPLFPFPDAPLAGELVEYRFIIDFAEIPVRSEPYFIRATISDGNVTIHSYAVGSLTISSLAAGTVDVGDLGFELAGVRFHGFSAYENLGADFIATSDMDLDGPEEFMIASRFGSPRNRFQSGAAYLIYGRRKTPFPPDTNDNGLPDTPAPDGSPVDYPEPPEYLPNPYDAQYVGRFGGTVSINSVNSFFRGTIYGMPEAHSDTPPPDRIYDAVNHPTNYTAGLMSITRVDMTLDGVPDLVFGLPYVSAAWDHHDDDPEDGGCEYPYGYAGDFLPNLYRCDDPPGNDDIVSPRNPPVPGWNEVNQGMVIMVDGTNDVRNIFTQFLDANLAGQHDPDGAVDDEGVSMGGDLIPVGMRFRGGWFDFLFRFIRDPSDSDCCVEHDGAGCEDLECQQLICSLPEEVFPDAADCCDQGDEEGAWEGYCAFWAQLFCNVCVFGNLRHYSDTEFGRTVARLTDFDDLPGDELLISSPGYDPVGGFLQDGSSAPLDLDDLDRGSIQVWLSHNFIDEDWYDQEVFSLPSYGDEGACTPGDVCVRGLLPLPSFSTVLGEQRGDHFGYAAAAGDYDQDGTEDIVAGAPGADRVPTDPDVICWGAEAPEECLEDTGVMYVLAVFHGGFGETDMYTNPLEHLKVIGSHAGDRFGMVQTTVQDMNGDLIADVAFGAEYYDDTQGINNDPPVGPDAGYVGVIFGDRPITGEQGFLPEDVGTTSLPGVRFVGAIAGALAGHDVASAGDFNGDGVGDLLITCPGETREVDGQTRLGVAYLIFGGQHLSNKSFNLSEVGTTPLPGIIFISRFEQGAIGEEGGLVTIETVGGLGDIDGDGFDDIAIGAPRADHVFPSSPNQRRPDAGEVYIVYGSNFGSNWFEP